MSCKHYGGLTKSPGPDGGAQRRAARSLGARGLLKMMLKERIMEMSRYSSSGLPYYRRLSPFALKLQVVSSQPPFSCLPSFSYPTRPFLRTRGTTSFGVEYITLIFGIED